MFKKLRSLVGKLFDENKQMLIVMLLSAFYWFLRKYFLSVEIKYPKKFINNWTYIKNFSSQDKERNFTVYQLINLHNEIFKNKKTNVIEFGVDRGATLTTICKFIKENTNIFALDSFGFYADQIKENVTKLDSHYLGSYKPFTKKTRFKEFDYLILQKELNEIIKEKNCDLDIIKCYFPDNIEECYKIKDKIVEELSEMFKDAKQIDLGTQESSFDTIGKSTVTTTYFVLNSNNDQASVACYDWSEEIKKEKNILDYLRVGILTKEFSDFVSFEAY